jgi:hypothetical protein
MFCKECELLARSQDIDGIMACLTSFASIATQWNQPERAARLLGAVEASLTNLDQRLALRKHLCLDTIMRTEYERIAAAACNALGDKTFAKGREMTLDEAIVCALENH